VEAVAAEVESRLASGPWEIPPRDEPPPTVVAAAEVATFALKLSGKRRQARSGSRLRRLITHFALAACLALASVAAACEKPDATEAEQAETIRTLPTASATDAVITQPARAGPARFEDLVLVSADSEQQPWAVLLPKSGGDEPILVDVGAGLTRPGSAYRIAANPISVGTRDGPSQFLDPLAPATETDSEAEPPANGAQVADRWREDERYLAATRAIRGQLTVLDAAYNAENAVAAGGTHTYSNGVVLRVDPDNPVLAVTDRALLESGRPTREEDVVYVAIRQSERSLYEAGQVVNLKDVVMNREQTDVEGQPRTMYIANAALDGARVEPAGRVDLQQLLGQRLNRVDSDLAAQAQEGDAAPAAAATPQATSTAGAPVQQPTVIRENRSSFVDDFLIFMLLTNSGFFRGPGVIINNPGPSPSRSGDIYYSSPPRPSGSGPSTVSSSQTDSRNTALQAARTSVSGQASGTGGGVAATNKAAADASARASAATTKASTVAGGVSTASAGKSITSVPKTSSSTASRSSGTVSAGARGGTSSSSGSSSSSGGKGIGGASSGGFGGSGATSGGSS
jgi:hypothetical protein